MNIQQAASIYQAVAGVAPDPAQQALGAAGADAAPGPSFFDMVSQSLDNIVGAGQKAEQVSKLALLGKADLTELALAVGGAEDALNTVVAIRDKIISAYQQIAQMPM